MCDSIQTMINLVYEVIYLSSLVKIKFTINIHQSELYKKVMSILSKILSIFKFVQVR